MVKSGREERRSMNNNKLDIAVNNYYSRAVRLVSILAQRAGVEVATYVGVMVSDSLLHRACNDRSAKVSSPAGLGSSRGVTLEFLGGPTKKRSRVGTRSPGQGSPGPQFGRVRSSHK